MSGAPLLQTIGRFDVMARADEVKRFRAALAAAGSMAEEAPDQAVPATWPVSWLMRPDIRQAIRGIPHFAHGACIQTGQELVSSRCVRVDTPYRMEVGWRSLDDALRVFEVVACVQEEDVGEILRMTSTLQIVTAGAKAT